MSFDLYTLIFLVLAVFIFFRLRSVLGTRTGDERPPVEPVRRTPADTSDKVVPLPTRQPDPAAAVPQTSGFRWKGHTEEGSDIARGFDAIAAADRSFDPATFLGGARKAYEMIVLAFSEGDRKALRPLLSREIYEQFAGLIAEREGRGETVQASFVSLDEATVLAALMKLKTAQVTVRFVSQMIRTTKDRAGTVIEGSPDQIGSVTDVWTFARDTSSNDPNWRLVGTEDV